MTSFPSNAGPARIALIGLGLNSFTNPSVLEALRRKFSGYEIDWIDLGPAVNDRAFSSVRHGANIIWEFAPRVGLNPWKLKRKRHFSTYLFRQRSAAAAKRLSRSRYLFSMQSQSMFDASTPGLPHFIYTDNTMLANLEYGMTRRELPVTGKWLQLERQSYHKARACFVMSTNVARSLVQHYGCPEDKVVCAYAGCNASVEQVERTSYSSKNILFVGVEWERKGGPELIKAFRLVRQQIPDATLTIVGCSPNLSELGCQVVGRVPPSDLKRYYTDAAVFCMPTRREPFGIAFIEAMAYELPVVATNVAAIPDFVRTGENGFLVSPGDTGALAARLTSLLNSPGLCQQMGRRSYEISKTYTWDNVAAIMRNTIERFVPALSDESSALNSEHLVRG